MSATPARYHWMIVCLHWLIALLILIALLTGGVVLKSTPNAIPDKIPLLRGHIAIGSLIGLLTVLRIAVRFKTAPPAPATAGNATLDRMARWVHYSLYLFVFSMVASGTVLAIQAGLPAAVFGGLGNLPETFSGFVPYLVHGAIALVLCSLIVGHAGAALYHQFFKRDGLLYRMSWKCK